MLALATAPRYRDPWAPSPEDARPVCLADLMTEAELHVGNYATVSRVRATLGLPITDPGLEHSLADLKLWPEGATPLPVDVSLILHCLPVRQRMAVYGRLAGLSLLAIAEQMGIAKGTVFVTLQSAAGFLGCAASCFGVHPQGDPDGLAGMYLAGKIMGNPGGRFHEASERLGISWVYTHADYCRNGCSHEDFLKLWRDHMAKLGIRG